MRVSGLPVRKSISVVVSILMSIFMYIDESIRLAGIGIGISITVVVSIWVHNRSSAPMYLVDAPTLCGLSLVLASPQPMLDRHLNVIQYSKHGFHVSAICANSTSGAEPLLNMNVWLCIAVYQLCSSFGYKVISKKKVTLSFYIDRNLFAISAVWLWVWVSESDA